MRRLIFSLIILGVAASRPSIDSLSISDAQLGAGSESLAARRLQADKGTPLQRVLRRYLDNEEMESHLTDFVKRCGAMARLTTIGKSAGGLPLWVLELSDKPGQTEAEPNVKILGNMHGDEPTGRVLTMALAEWLCANYRKDAVAQRIVQGVHLWLAPSLNPDGFAARTRHNKNGKDLNRNFPDRFSGRSMVSSGREEPESRAIMEWITKTHFVSSIAFHEGALVANYPWDGTPNKTTEYTSCPDDATFRHLASVYALTHRTMALPSNAEFPHGGITNGAAWYPIYGSMQDWNYIMARCMELTVEVSEGKWPEASGLAELFEDNRRAMLAFILKSSLGGVRGTIMAESNFLRKSKGQELQPISANITVEGLDGFEFVVRSGRIHGDYYRPLAPGRYTLLVRKDGYMPSRSNVTVPEDGSGVMRNFVLRERKPPATRNMVMTASSVIAAAADISPHDQVRDHMTLVTGGLVLLLGLWDIHKRMVRRAGVLGRHRSM